MKEQKLMSGISSNNKQIAKNTLFLYGRMLIVLFVSIYTTRVVLNVLGIEDYGIYNVVCGFVAMFGFLNTSLSNGIQRFYNYEFSQNGEEGLKRVFQTSLLIQLCLAILIGILVETIGIWYINTRMVIPTDRIVAANWIFQFSVISLLLVIIQIPYSAAILAHERMDYYAIVSIIDVLLKLGIILLLPYFDGDQLTFYGVLQVFVSLLDFILYWGYSKIQFKELVVEKVFHKDLFSSIFKFSGWNIFATFAWMTQGQGVNMVVNLFFGTVINAARGVSGQIQSAIQGFCENLVIAFRPQLVQSYAQGNIERTEKMMFSMSKMMFILFGALSLPLCLEIDYILSLWLGDSIPEYTAGFTILVLLSMFPRNFTLAFAQIVHATGRLGKFQVVTAVIVMFSLPITYLFLELGYNPMSVYWINLAMCVVLFCGCIIVLKQCFPINLINYLKYVLWPCLLLAAVVIPITYSVTVIMSSSFCRLVIVTLVSSASILFFSLLFVLTNEEKRLLKSFMKK